MLLKKDVSCILKILHIINNTKCKLLFPFFFRGKTFCDGLSSGASFHYFIAISYTAQVEWQQDSSKIHVY